eukprot:TRINITY_DN8685_c2_g1_i1.p1 TRINITY_DN8685_c2_g1~~TRINITY_DN8685_c2_g1_i1.p1  ORF type:complete len:641 (+),score=240.05 TRINITY_DN8685_c2_g1_i1:109-1923(+)
MAATAANEVRVQSPGRRRRTRRGAVKARSFSTPTLRRRGCPASPKAPQGWRFTSEYAGWFMSQRPSDPRLCPPVLNTDNCLAALRAAEERQLMLSPEVTPTATPAGSPTVTPAASPRAEDRVPVVRLNGELLEEGRQLQQHSPPRPSNGLSPNARPFVPQRQDDDASTPPPGEPCGGGSPGGRGSPGDRTVRSSAGSATSRRPAVELPVGDPALWSLSKLRDRLPAVAMDPDGSRGLQRFIDSCGARDTSIVLDELLPAAQEVLTDVAGNHVMQKLLEKGGAAASDSVAAVLAGDIGTLAKQTYACRIIQRVLDNASDGVRKSIAAELEGSVGELIEDQNGNHVVQKCLEVMPDNCTFVVKTVSSRVGTLACHPYGCRVVQRVLEYCRQGSEIVPILEEVLKKVHSFVCDQYGNYVVQHVIANGHPQYRFAVTTRLRGHFGLLSMHKFASNVVEKMYEHATPQLRDAMLDELMAAGHGQSSPNARVSGFVEAAVDQYGNYVVQKIFDLSTEVQRMRLLRHLAPHLDKIRTAPYGRHLAARLERYDACHAQSERRTATPHRPEVWCGSQPVAHTPIQYLLVGSDVHHVAQPAFEYDCGFEPHRVI